MFKLIHTDSKTFFQGFSTMRSCLPKQSQILEQVALTCEGVRSSNMPVFVFIHDFET